MPDLVPEAVAEHKDALSDVYFESAMPARGVGVLSRNAPRAGQQAAGVARVRRFRALASRVKNSRAGAPGNGWPTNWRPCSRLAAGEADRRRSAEDLSNITTAGAVMIDLETAKRLQRAASEYRSTYYRAHNALKALRKAQDAEQKPGTAKNTGKTDERGSAQKDDRAAGNDGSDGRGCRRRPRRSLPRRPLQSEQRSAPRNAPTRTRGWDRARIVRSPGRAPFDALPVRAPREPISGVRLRVEFDDAGGLDRHAYQDGTPLFQNRLRCSIGEIRAETQEEPGFGNGAPLQSPCAERAGRHPGRRPETRDPE